MYRQTIHYNLWVKRSVPRPALTHHICRGTVIVNDRGNIIASLTKDRGVHASAAVEDPCMSKRLLPACALHDVSDGSHYQLDHQPHLPCNRSEHDLLLEPALDISLVAR